MLILASVADKIEVITDAAVTVDVHASWIDHVSPNTQTPGNTNTAISTAATTTVVGSPAASTYRNVKTLQLRNKHASTSVTVTVRHVNGTATVETGKWTLLAGETVGYVDGEGFIYRDANGIPKVGTAVVMAVTRLAADLANSTTTAAKVTGLDTAMGLGTWIFEYYLHYTTVITTTGIKFGVNHSGTVTTFLYDMFGVDTSATAATGAMDQDALAATGQVMAAWAARVKSTSAPMITVGVDTNAGDMFMRITGMTIVTAAGNLELYSASEVGTSSTSVKAGSSLRLTKVG
jgi:hypothetical protein